MPQTIQERLIAAGLLAPVPIPKGVIQYGASSMQQGPRAEKYARAALASEAEAVASAVDGTRNDTLNRSAWKLRRLVEQGHLDAQFVIDTLTGALAHTPNYNHHKSVDTVERAIEGAVNKTYEPATSTFKPDGPDQVTFTDSDDVFGIGSPSPPDAPGGEADSKTDARNALAGLMVAGDTFILDAPDRVPSIWGNEDDSVVLWAKGEALTLVGPPGVGKTTLAGQVISARLGHGAKVLGFPVVQTQSRVLYLAMDRPQQIRRALRRHLGSAARELLRDRLIAWQGPPPEDLAKNPALLLALAQAAQADTVVVDSMKDAAVGLDKDEGGSGYNRARQLCLANGIEILELHHMTKRGANGAAPTKLADVYGSTFVTGGSGSVILLWGEAGDPIVELFHLKQPGEAFGPVRVSHDHALGITEIYEEVDLVQLAASRAGIGLSAKDAAIALFEKDEPSRAEVMKARRRLEKLTQAGRLRVVVDEHSGAKGTVRWGVTFNPGGAQ